MERDLLYFFSHCRNKSDGELARLECTIEHKTKHYKQGDYIAYQGDKITHLYMLVKGKVKTEIVSSSGLTLPVEEISAPYPLASVFLFADINQFPVDVIAEEDCDLYLIKKEVIELQMAKCPGFLRGFMAFNANRTKYLSERLKLFAQHGIKAKIAYYILQREVKGEFELGITIASLAEHFVVERPSLSRAIAEMVKRKIISLHNGKGKILNSNALMELIK
jgi:CRP/FNR family transcriptional regulator, dissimilatory nitrate respiration regulator